MHPLRENFKKNNPEKFAAQEQTGSKGVKKLIVMIAIGVALGISANKLLEQDTLPTEVSTPTTNSK